MVDRLYSDVLHTVGNSSNIVQTVAARILGNDRDKLDDHLKRWLGLKRRMENWLEEMNLQCVPNTAVVTYWVESPIEDTYKWTNQITIKKHQLAAVPGAFFLFKGDNRIVKSKMLRLGLGAIDPEARFGDALEALEKTLRTQ
jgi:hypothetical protein